MSCGACWPEPTRRRATARMRLATAVRRWLALMLGLCGLGAQGATAQLTPCRLKGVEHEALCGSVARALDPTQPERGAHRIALCACCPPWHATRSPTRCSSWLAGRGRAPSAGWPAEPHVGAFRPPSRHRAGRSARVPVAAHRWTATPNRPRCRCENWPTRSARWSGPRLPAQAAGLAARRPAPLHDDSGHGRPGRCAPGIGRRAHQPGGRVLWHPGRARVPAAVSAAGSARGARRRGARPTWRCPRLRRLTPRPPSTRCCRPVRRSRPARPATPSCARTGSAVLAGLPRPVRVAHPLTGRDEELLLTRDMLLAMVRTALYSPATASALPAALDEAAAGRFAAAGRPVQRARTGARETPRWRRACTSR